MNKNAYTLGVGKARKARFEFALKFLAILMAFYGPIQWSQASNEQTANADDEKIIEQIQREPSPKASAEEFRAYLQNMEILRQDLLNKSKKAAEAVQHLSSQLEEKESRSQEIDEHLGDLDEKHEKLIKERGMLPRVAANCRQAKTNKNCADLNAISDLRAIQVVRQHKIGAEIEEIEKRIQFAIDRKEAHENHLGLLDETVANLDQKKSAANKPLPAAPSVTPPVKTTADATTEPSVPVIPHSSTKPKPTPSTAMSSATPPSSTLAPPPPPPPGVSISTQTTRRQKHTGQDTQAGNSVEIQTDLNLATSPSANGTTVPIAPQPPSGNSNSNPSPALAATKPLSTKTPVPPKQGDTNSVSSELLKALEIRKQKSEANAEPLTENIEKQSPSSMVNNDKAKSPTNPAKPPTIPAKPPTIAAKQPNQRGFVLPKQGAPKTPGEDPTAELRNALEKRKQLIADPEDMTQDSQASKDAGDKFQSHTTPVLVLNHRENPDATQSKPTPFKDRNDELQQTLQRRRNSLSPSLTGLEETDTISGNPYRGATALKTFEENLKSDDTDLRHRAILEMSQLTGNNYNLIGHVFEQAYLSPHEEVRTAADAILANYPKGSRMMVKKYLENSDHEYIRTLKIDDIPYPEMIEWIQDLPNHLNGINEPAKSCVTGCTAPTKEDTEKLNEEKLMKKRYRQLDEIYTTEKTYQLGVKYLIEDKIHDKTLIDEFIDKKLISNSDIKTLEESRNSLKQILALSKNILSKMEPNFLETKIEKDSILQMEKSILTHLSLDEIKKPYHDYFVNFKKFNAILEKIENLEKGKKIIEDRHNETNSTHLFTPTASSFEPLQRFIRYGTLLKAITDRNDQRLDFESFDELTKLSKAFVESTKEINKETKEAEEKSAHSIWNFWKQKR